MEFTFCYPTWLFSSYLVTTYISPFWNKYFYFCTYCRNSLDLCAYSIQYSVISKSKKRKHCTFSFLWRGGGCRPHRIGLICTCHSQSSCSKHIYLQAKCEPWDAVSYCIKAELWKPEQICRYSIMLQNWMSDKWRTEHLYTHWKVKLWVLYCCAVLFPAGGRSGGKQKVTVVGTELFKDSGQGLYLPPNPIELGLGLPVFTTHKKFNCTTGGNFNGLTLWNHLDKSSSLARDEVQF